MTKGGVYAVLWMYGFLPETMSRASKYKKVQDEQNLQAFYNKSTMEKYIAILLNSTNIYNIAWFPSDYSSIKNDQSIVY